MLILSVHTGRLSQLYNIMQTAVQTGGNLLDGRNDGTVHIIAISELIKYGFYDGKAGKVGDIFSAARLFDPVLYNRAHSPECN